MSVTDTSGNLTRDEIARLFDAGASPEFVQFANYETEGRNSVLENARRALGRDDPSTAAGTFGHFGDYLWDGKVHKAMERADGANTDRLLELFGLAYINAKAEAAGSRTFKREDGRVVWE